MQICCLDIYASGDGHTLGYKSDKCGVCPRPQIFDLAPLRFGRCPQANIWISAVTLTSKTFAREMRSAFFNKWRFDIPEWWYNQDTSTQSELTSNSFRTLHAFLNLLGHEARELRDIQVTTEVSVDEVTKEDVKEALRLYKGLLHRNALITIHVGHSIDPRYKWWTIRCRVFEDRVEVVYLDEQRGI